MSISLRNSLFAAILLLTTPAFADNYPPVAPVPDVYAPWMLGPFVRPDTGGKSILQRDPDLFLDDPIRKSRVYFNSQNVLNPAAVVRNGKVYLLYRCLDGSSNPGVGPTSRIGLAISEDGIHFKKRPKPVLYPDNDSEKIREWPGGCEDPRAVELEDGTYVLYYTQYSGRPPVYAEENGVPMTTATAWATSKDLIHWKKRGPVMVMDNGKLHNTDRGDALVSSVQHGRLVAQKINGKYWMYYGGGTLHLMSSPDLKHWTLAQGFAIAPRKDKFDSGLVEGGPGSAVLTARGIVMPYNGENETDPEYRKQVYTDGQLLFDAKDPTKLLDRSDKPFYQPVTPYETAGRGICFIEGLVLFHNKWLLYYGAADMEIGMAIAKVKPGEIMSGPVAVTSR